MLILRQVKQYHHEMGFAGFDMRVMAFCKPEKPYQWRKTGWVVSGYAGDDSHRIFDNKKEAQEFISSILDA